MLTGMHGFCFFDLGDFELANAKKETSDDVVELSDGASVALAADASAPSKEVRDVE